MDAPNEWSVEAIRAELAGLSEEQRSHDAALRTLLQRRDEMDTLVEQLGKIGPTLQNAHTRAKALAARVEETHKHTKIVAGKVRLLDTAKTRLQNTMVLVDNILEIEGCAEGVVEALESGDYEKAAIFIHRYLQFDQSLLQTRECLGGDQPIELLNEKKEEVRMTIRAQFLLATEMQDDQAVARYFKLYPMVHLHAEGINAYGEYAAQLIQIKAVEAKEDAKDKHGAVNFVDAITVLYEGAAALLESQRAAVETHYGEGYIAMLAARLLDAVDNEADGLISEYIGKRDLNQLIQTVQNATAEDESAPDPRHLDSVLAELSMMIARTVLFFNFLRKQISDDVESLKRAKPHDKLNLLPEVDVNFFASIQSHCSLAIRQSELTVNFDVLEGYFLQRSVAKALAMDSVEEDSHTSTAVDDCFFVVSKSCRRAISTGADDCFCVVFNSVSDILGDTFSKSLTKPLDKALSNRLDFRVIQGQLSRLANRGTSSDDEDKPNVLILINNMALCEEYCKRLQHDLRTQAARNFSQATDAARGKVESCIEECGQLAARYRQHTQNYVDRLVETAVSPTIRTLADTIANASYELTQDEAMSTDGPSPAMATFVEGLLDVTKQHKPVLDEEPFNFFAESIATATAQHVESTLFKCSFNQLGALQLDRDVRYLGSFLTSISQWSVRDKLSRLSQVVTLVCLDKPEEVYEYWGLNSGRIVWELTPKEVRNALNLRVDFNSSQIKSLKL